MNPTSESKPVYAVGEARASKADRFVDLARLTVARVDARLIELRRDDGACFWPTHRALLADFVRLLESPMLIPSTIVGRAERLIAALLPPKWPTRETTLDAAGRLDHELGDVASDQLLQAFVAWRATGVLPATSPLRDLVGVLADLLGAAPELRLSPRRTS